MTFVSDMKLPELVLFRRHEGKKFAEVEAPGS